MTKILMIALILSGVSAAADTVICKGTRLSFTFTRADGTGKASDLRDISSDMDEVTRDLQASAKNDIYGPEASQTPGRTDYYEGTFQSPSTDFEGQWQLDWNPQTGSANLVWDNNDGGIETYDLTCSVSK
jgi:hypothetical protein